MAQTIVNRGVTHVFGMVATSNVGLADARRRYEEAGKLDFIDSSPGDGLVFGADGVRAVDTGKLQARADVAWKAAGIQRITPHAGRHLYASMSAAAATPIERLSRYTGDSSIAVT